MYIKRILEEELKQYLHTKEIIAVVGPRQSGKTTLLKQIFKHLKNACFLDFEDRETLTLFDEDLNSFIDLYVKPYKYLFIDEFQYTREGGKQLKYIYDHYKTKIILSGSSASSLSINSIQYLVGRIFVFTLHPFSFIEYLSYAAPNLYALLNKKRPLSQPITHQILPYFKTYTLYGGYPRVILAKNNKEKELVLKNIYNTYFLKEIKEILNLPYDYKLTKLIHALALQIGNIISYTELSTITGFHYKDLLTYMNILEKTFITIRSQPYYTNKRTELVKSPKIYFFDNGFRNIILKNFQQLINRQDKGMLYENFIASEIIKTDTSLRYWKTKSQAEVDFIIEKNGKPIPIEIKSTLQQPKCTKSYNSFLDKYKPLQGFILSETLSATKKVTLFRPLFTINQLLRNL